MTAEADEIIKGYFTLIGKGLTDRVRAALDAAPQFIDVVGPHPFWGGRPQALHVAIEGHRRDIFDLLLERGANVDGRNDQYDHWSPLMLAIHRGNDEMRDELLARRARVGVVEALMLGDDARLDALFDAHGLPAIVPNGGSLLAFARSTHAIDRLLDLGAQTDQPDRWGTTPIESMSRLGGRGRPLVQHLIARGVSVRPEDYAKLGDIEALAAIVDKDSAIVRRDSVLMAAVTSRHHDLVEWLLAHGADPNARETARSRQTALHDAAWNGDLRMARILVAAGANPSLRDEEHNNTPLGWAEVSRDVTNNPSCSEVAEYLRSIT